MRSYKGRSIRDLDKKGNYYSRHIDAMTREKLHGKAEIAAELAHRDMVIDTLKVGNVQLNKFVSYLLSDREDLDDEFIACQNKEDLLKVIDTV